MFRDLYNKSKDVAEKVEAKVREATSDEAWGATGSLMLQIANYTHMHATYREVMETLYKRLHPVSNSNWRRVYKSLLLLDFLLKNGSERVRVGSREHIYDLRSLESFHYCDENGKDHGINVRLRVQDIIKLLQDDEYFKQEQAKAMSLRHLHGQGGGTNRYSSNWGNSFDSRYSEEDTTHDRYDNWQASPPERRFHSVNDSQLTPNPKLGNFDEWHVGRERGVADDVVEQIREAWGMAKLATRSILNKTVHQPDIYETNPRMVSEEMYTFPECSVEAGSINNCEPADQLPAPVTQRSTGARHPWQRNSTGISSQQSSSSATATAKAPRLPRSPSLDLISSWDGSTTGAPSGAGLSAQPDLGTSLWPGETGQSLHANNWASGFSTSHVVNSKPTEGISDADDFGEFVSAVPSDPMQVLFPTPTNGGFVQQPPSQAGVGNDDLFAVFQTSVTPAQAWPPVAPSASLLTNNINQTPITPSSVHMSDSVSTKVSLASPPEEPSAGTNCKAASAQQSNQPIGSSGLWNDIGSLGIDLDTIACPTKAGVRSAGPSLRQLQQQHSFPAAAQVSPTSRTPFS